jgi:redox-regulated HSP33 family molecular chaperone
MHTDCVQPFLFEHLDIRGALVSLDKSWQSLNAGRDYPTNVTRILGEMTAVTTLISANLKQPTCWYWTVTNNYACAAWRGGTRRPCGKTPRCPNCSATASCC